MGTVWLDFSKDHLRDKEPIKYDANKVFEKPS